MTRRKNNPKSSSERKNNGHKRKVISPIEVTQRGIHNSQTGSNGQEEGGVQTEEVNAQTNKRLHFSSPELCVKDTPINSYTMATNYQQTPYSPQYTQLSPGYPPGQWPPAPPAQNSMPAWASVLIEDIKTIKQDLQEIHQIKKTVNLINSKITDLESKVTNIDGRMIEVEKSCSFIHADIENKTQELKKAKTDISDLQKKREIVEGQINQMKEDMRQMNEKMIDNESRSMRNNLIFYGIEEKEQENCENEIKKFIREKLEINTDQIILDRTHRMGNQNARKPRPIVSCFHYYSDRENVRSKGYQANQQLKQQGFGISIQRPKQVRDARKSLYNVMKHERDVKGNRVKFIGDRLYINDILYVPPK